MSISMSGSRSASPDSGTIRPTTDDDDDERSVTSSHDDLTHVQDPADLLRAASYFHRSSSQPFRPSSTSENDPSSVAQSQTEESVCLTLSSDDETAHTPPLPPMETNVEGDVHKLRIRLIEAESKRQRARSHEPSKHSPRKHSRTTEDFDGQRLPMRGSSREVNRLPPSMHDMYSSRQRASRQMMMPGYAFDSRLYLPPVNEESLFETSNMDDLIESIARRRLAYRLLQANYDPRSRGAFPSPYFDRTNSEQIFLRNDDGMSTYRSSRSHSDRDTRRAQTYDQIIRPRRNHHEPDSSDMGMGSSSREDSGVKLPPINTGRQAKPSRSLSVKSDPHPSRQTLPFVPTEHLIKLPSDIYASSKAEHSSRKTRRRRRRRSTSSEESSSESDQSGEDTDLSTDHRRKRTSHNNDPISSVGTHQRHHHHHQQQQHQQQQHKKSKVHRNPFRKAAIGVLFTVAVKRSALKNQPHRAIQSPREAIHRIRLQELLVAVHRVYLEPDGPIFNALTQAVTHPVSLQHALDSSSRHHEEAIDTIATAMKDVIAKIIEFMPKDGVLGTTKTSAISVFLQNGNPFPENYFWQCEREQLEFDGSELINISKPRASLLIIGLFIFRGLVTTLLIKPVKYRLILGQLTPSQSASLKVLSSLMLYLGRRVGAPKGDTLALPQEWRLSLYTDADLAAVLRHADIRSILSSCEHSLRTWCDEYIRRIDETAGKTPRR